MGVYDYHHDSGRSDRPQVQEDAPLCENAQETLTVSPYKAYVEVIADFSSDGRMKPLRLIWEDGRKYDIDRILRVDRCASLRAGGAGIRYVCRILGKKVDCEPKDAEDIGSRVALPDRSGNGWDRAPRGSAGEGRPF